MDEFDTHQTDSFSWKPLIHSQSHAPNRISLFHYGGEKARPARARWRPLTGRSRVVRMCWGGSPYYPRLITPDKIWRPTSTRSDSLGIHSRRGLESTLNKVIKRDHCEAIGLTSRPMMSTPLHSMEVWFHETYGQSKCGFVIHVI